LLALGSVAGALTLGQNFHYPQKEEKGKKIISQNMSFLTNKLVLYLDMERVSLFSFI
jgi:hypothetical protein